ncbi:uncharacterized protein LOC133308734 [Gastrolobium bilobum]|uniref:uncharacterized protein LOC133308734 n=1 Tax=Gastrolobium bilobum TaxID=150636 RepID=UPI002AAF9942|nr:uncharacterized protein LOC133308734 [Gastrolobium bilobum]
MVVVELDNLRLSGDLIKISQMLTQLSSPSSYSYENDFLKDTERKFLIDIKNCIDATTCITYGTIKSIESKYNWWYRSCKKCPYSVCEDFEKWFSVQVRVVDNIDSASFVLLDRDCLALLGVSAAELREQHFKRGANLEHYPEELNVLKDKSMLFKFDSSVDGWNIVDSFLHLLSMAETSAPKCVRIDKERNESLTNLPSDVQLEILGKVASNSIEDLCNVKETCNDFRNLAENDVYKQSSLEKFACSTIDSISKQKPFRHAVDNECGSEHED